MILTRLHHKELEVTLPLTHTKLNLFYSNLQMNKANKYHNHLILKRILMLKILVKKLEKIKVLRRIELTF